MGKRIAVLDLGTNTFHLLIAEVNSNNFNTIVAQQEHAKLGEGGINTGIITETAYQRGMQALRQFKIQIDQHNVTTIKATGTAALRSAQNGKDFINQVKQETGICIEIIPGDSEAGLIYQGVKAAIQLADSSLIMDIGGGSVEFIFCNRHQIFWKKSYPIGAAKLMAQFHHSDPITEQETQQIIEHLSHILTELIEKNNQFKPQLLVGSAGAFETFAALAAHRINYNFELQNSNKYTFKGAELKIILKELISSSHNEREQNTLIIPVRTDMIVVAAVLTQYVIDTLNLSQIALSKYALKEGLLFSVSDMD